MQIVWNIREVASALAAFDAPGLLATRSVVVPNGRLAHSLRRELVRAGRADLLNGTRFATAEALAAEILEEAGVPFRAGEESHRASRLRALLRNEPALRSLDVRFLRDSTGWDEALAHTIEDLESAALDASSFANRAADDHERDLATLWAALDESAAESWTGARILREAARRAAGATAAPIDRAPVLAVLTGDESAGACAFLRAIAASPLLFGARPMSPGLITRIEALWGPEAAAVVRYTSAPRRSGAKRLDALSSWIFEDPETRARTAPHAAERNPGDRSFCMEEYAGIDDELDGAVDWVAREVCERRTPLDRIALLVPEPDPLLSLLASRLGRLEWTEGEPPVYIAGGLPLASTSDGAQALALLDVLSEGLAGEALLELLPTFRNAPWPQPTPESEPPWPARLSRDRARRVLTTLGTFGPLSPPITEPDRSLRERLRERRRELEESTREPPADPRFLHVFEEERRVLALLYGISPALDALFSLEEEVLGDATIDDLSISFRRFVREWLFTPGRRDGRERQRGDHSARADERLSPAFRDLVETNGTLRGREAVRAFAETARRIRVPVGRFGTPLLYLGTIRDAIGIPFRSVRFVGCAEGAFPRPVREDPLLPDVRRRRIGAALPLAASRPESDKRSLYRILSESAATHEPGVVLSTSRTDADGTVHEPSPLFLEAVASVQAPRVPDLRTLREHELVPARRAAREARLAAPVHAGAFLERAASRRVAPSSWLASPALDLARLDALQREPPFSHGLLDADVLTTVRGLSPERPTSASDLRRLLECPHRYLQERILRRRAPEELPSVRDLGLPRYGHLYHRAVDRLFREHGSAFFRREHLLARAQLLPPYWEDRGREAARREIDELALRYPLEESSRDGYRMRLESAVVAFLRHEWEAPPREYAGSERAFGYDEPVAIETPGGELFVRGDIDRIDRDAVSALVRDFKTGVPHPRERREVDPIAGIDLQLGLYVEVARRQAAEWGIPPRVVGAFSYATAWGIVERSFADDPAELDGATRAWLSLAAGLLRTRAFPRTPDPDDCRHCAFRPACGPDAQTRSRARLESEPEGPLRGLLLLKVPQPPEDSGEEAAVP